MKHILSGLVFAGFYLLSLRVAAQGTDVRYMRIARIVVDSAQLEAYKAALKDGVTTAVREEPGVISLYAVYDKRQPTHVTVFEVYKDEQAYKMHIQTAHFLKYKAAVSSMVKSLELSDVGVIVMEGKGER